jgi:hypothetical protein
MTINGDLGKISEATVTGYINSPGETKKFFKKPAEIQTENLTVTLNIHK